MNCKISAEKTIMLDKLLKTTKSEFITFDTTASSVVIQLALPNFSQYTIIRLEQDFFESLEVHNKIFTIPFQKFYKPQMLSMEIEQIQNKSIFNYTMLNSVTYKKCITTLDIDLFDLEFDPAQTVKMDLLCMQKIIKNIKDKFITLSIGKGFEIKSDTMQITSEDLNDSNKKSFKIETEKLKNILSISDLFDEFVVSYDDDEAALNIIFRGLEIFVSTFFTVERE